MNYFNCETIANLSLNMRQQIAFCLYNLTSVWKIYKVIILIIFNIILFIFRKDNSHIRHESCAMGVFRNIRENDSKYWVYFVSFISRTKCYPMCGLNPQHSPQYKMSWQPLKPLRHSVMRSQNVIREVK